VVPAASRGWGIEVPPSQHVATSRRPTSLVLRLGRTVGGIGNFFRSFPVDNFDPASLTIDQPLMLVLDIVHLLARKPRELSGGQQQRVALGRALVRDPRVFLMDEPLSNLDAKLRVQMRSEIKRFHQDLNATVIYITHDQLEAVTLADKMAVMNGGLRPICAVSSRSLQKIQKPRGPEGGPIQTRFGSLDRQGFGSNIQRRHWMNLLRCNPGGRVALRPPFFVSLLVSLVSCFIARPRG